MMMMASGHLFEMLARSDSTRICTQGAEMPGGNATQQQLLPPLESMIYRSLRPSLRPPMSPLADAAMRPMCLI